MYRFHLDHIDSHRFNYTNAKAQCEADGTHLAIPRSYAENSFIAGLGPGYKWLGINDIEEEGQFKTVDGSDLIFDNWAPGWPTEDVGPNHAKLWDGVVLHTNTLWLVADPKKWHSFVCLDSEEFLSKNVATEDDDETQNKSKPKIGLDVFLGSLVSASNIF